jgi:hypothetical protein
MGAISHPHSLPRPYNTTPPPHTELNLVRGHTELKSERGQYIINIQVMGHVDTLYPI